MAAICLGLNVINILTHFNLNKVGQIYIWIHGACLGISIYSLYWWTWTYKHKLTASFCILSFLSICLIFTIFLPMHFAGANRVNVWVLKISDSVADVCHNRWALHHRISILSLNKFYHRYWYPICLVTWIHYTNMLPRFLYKVVIT